MSDFYVALPQKQKIGDVVEVYGMRGRIVEWLTHEEYLEIWAFKGFPSEGISLNPRAYYRCERLDGEAAETCSD